MSDRRRSARRVLAAVGVAAAVGGVVAAGAVAFGALRDRARDAGSTVAGLADGLRDPPPPDRYGTADEVGTRGDPGNPGERFGGDFPSDEDTQERAVGAPARLSGFTTWVERVDRVPASPYVDGYDGDFLRVTVRVFNRDRRAQSAGAVHFWVWNREEGYRSADFVGPASTLAHSVLLDPGEQVRGDVFLYVGGVDDVFVVYRPDLYTFSDPATAVWRP
ncbi:MAG: hypothetical protein KatS3mg009_0758 [Acidimicrobiia bacterium]|nr:MAG: hypothetical protein KatS3mg009_0758 [Acidimicrobiia bacterium]